MLYIVFGNQILFVKNEKKWNKYKNKEPFAGFPMNAQYINSSCNLSTEVCTYLKIPLIFPKEYFILFSEDFIFFGYLI